MTVSICRSCRYEQSDCKGVKSIDTARCDYFKEKLAINYPARIRELKAENEKLKAECNKYWCHANCEKCENKCRAWQNGFNAKGGNISFESIQMLRRIVDEVTPEWVDKNCISCAWFNNLKGVGGYCAYHNNKTTAKGGCNKWAKECDTDE